MSVARLTIPSGIVPDLREFTRHVWRFRGEDGLAVIGPPPVIYSLALDDPDDVVIAGAEMRRLRDDFEFGDRVTIDYGKPLPIISFRDVETLHTFIRLIAMRAGRDGGWIASGSPDGYKARMFGAFVMETLGFEWA